MKAVIFLVLLCFGLIFAVNPGFKARVTQSGLDYANTVAMKALSTSIQKLNIPDQSGKSGRLEYSLSGMKVKSFTTPTSSMLLSAKGIKWSASGAGMSMHGNFKYKYKKGWFKISDHGSFDASLGGVNFVLEVSLTDSAGKPRLSGNACSSGISSAKIKFHGGASWLYNLFSKAISGKIKDALKSKMCGLVVQAINQDANKQLAKLPMKVVVAKKFELDYSLNSNPSFNSKYMETFHKGEVFWKGDTNDCPFSPAPFPFSSNRTRMLYLWVSEYMGNSLAYAGFKHGFLQYNLTAKDLPAGNRSLLNTTCRGVKCIGSIIPQIGQKYPNSTVMFRMHSTAAPQIQITAGIISMNFSGDVDLYAQTPQGKTPFLLTITCVFVTNVTATIEGQLVKGKISSTKLKVGVKNSQVGPVPSFVLQLMMNAAIDGYVVPTLNAQGQKGLELPVTENIRFRNAQLALIENAIMIATDLSYLSDEELARQGTGDNMIPGQPFPYDTRDPDKSFKVIGRKNNMFDKI